MASNPSFTIYNRKILFAILVMSALTLALFAVARAQTDGSADPNKEAALKELSQVTGQTIGSAEDAKKICNQEQHLTSCAEIGKKYKLYKEERLKEVNAVLEEMKGKVVDELRSCNNEECLVNVADKLAKQMALRNPEIASKFEMTAEKVRAKRVIIEKARELGVSFQECRAMDPESAPIELLRACAKLAKDDSVRQYIPEEARKQADQNESVIKLKESLQQGRYQCGDGTVDGCGNFCLNVSAEARGQGTAAIPAVCRQIAKEIFGSEGEKQLEASYNQVSQTHDFYRKRAENIVFVTDDGRKLFEPQEIGRYLEEQGKIGNIGAIEKGMDFMVTNGFVKPEEKEFALKMMKEFSAKGAPPADFDRCRENPESCQEFIPQDFREEFKAKRQVEQVMRDEMTKLGVADPRLCNDPAYAQKCAEASKSFLPRLESIQGNSQIIANIKRNVEFSNHGFEARKRMEQEFQKGGAATQIGDRAFSNFQEMEQFCSQNGSACLTEATKKGFVDPGFAVQKYGEAFERMSQAPQHFFPGQPGQFGGQFGPQGRSEQSGSQGQGGPGGFGFPGQGRGTEGQFPGRGEGVQGGFPARGFGPPTGGTQQFDSQFGGGFPGFPGGFNKEEALKQFKTWAENPESAPPPTHLNFPGANFRGQGDQGEGGRFPGQRDKPSFRERRGETKGQFPGQTPQGELKTGEFKSGEGQRQRPGEFPGRGETKGQFPGQTPQGEFPGQRQGFEFKPGEFKPGIEGQPRPGEDQFQQRQQQQFPSAGDRQPQQPFGDQFKPTEGQQNQQFQQQQPSGDQFREPGTGDFRPQEGQQYQQFQQQPSGGTQFPSGGEFQQPSQQPSGGTFQQPSGEFQQQPSGTGTFTPGSILTVFQSLFGKLFQIFKR